MSDRFLTCLAWILQKECGYPQTPDGPLRRTRDGGVWDERKGLLVLPNGTTRALPTRPDGMAYDDDPHDTGGRTCMGVLQRVYNGYRSRHGLPLQDVWRISDREIKDIYFRQYWLPLNAEALPGGIDLSVFDMGVNAGIGTGARLLQRVVGTAVDGQIGEATIEATNVAYEADGEALIRKYAAARVNYYKQCRTYWKHGKGWLARNESTLKVALGQIEDARAVAEPEPVKRVANTDAQPSSEPANSATVTVAGGSGATLAVEVSGAATKLASKDVAPSYLDIALVVMQSPTFWLALGTLCGAVYFWLNERARKRIFG